MQALYRLLNRINWYNLHQIYFMTLLESYNASTKNTLMEALGIQFTEIGDNYLSASMPVDKRTHQPMGLLHGGATVALAETLGSMGSYMRVKHLNKAIVGVEINANHISSARSGLVIGTSTLIHEGRKTHVWNTEIKDEKGKLISVCRLTVMVINAKSE